MERFIHDQNLERYMTLLDSEPDEPAREALRALLIEEEDRFGARRERLEAADRHIARLRERMHRQVELIELLNASGADIAPAVDLHRNWGKTLIALETYRRLIRDDQDRARR